MKEKEEYRYIDNAIWALMLTESGLSIEKNSKGEWLFHDGGKNSDYGEGDTPQEALDDYIQSARERVLIEQDYIREQLQLE